MGDNKMDKMASGPLHIPVHSLRSSPSESESPTAPNKAIDNFNIVASPPVPPSTTPTSTITTTQAKREPHVANDTTADHIDIQLFKALIQTDRPSASLELPTPASGAPTSLAALASPGAPTTTTSTTTRSLAPAPPPLSAATPISSGLPQLVVSATQPDQAQQGRISSKSSQEIKLSPTVAYSLASATPSIVVPTSRTAPKASTSGETSVSSDMSNMSNAQQPGGLRQSIGYSTQSPYTIPSSTAQYPAYPTVPSSTPQHPPIHSYTPGGAMSLPGVHTLDHMSQRQSQQAPAPSHLPLAAHIPPTVPSTVPNTMQYYGQSSMGMQYGMTGYGLHAGIMGRPKKEIKRRTKTGCMTCRKRRIKCDEGQPTCNNCRKSKRECAGYDPIFKPTQQHQQQQPGPATIQPAPNQPGQAQQPPPPAPTTLPSSAPLSSYGTQPPPLPSSAVPVTAPPSSARLPGNIKADPISPLDTAASVSVPLPVPVPGSAPPHIPASTVVASRESIPPPAEPQHHQSHFHNPVQAQAQAHAPAHAHRKGGTSEPYLPQNTGAGADPSGDVKMEAVTPTQQMQELSTTRDKTSLYKLVEKVQSAHVCRPPTYAAKIDNLVLNFNNYYDKLYCLGLTEFFESKWYRTNKPNIRQSDALLHLWAAFCESFPSDYPDPTHAPYLEAQVIWALATQAYITPEGQNANPALVGEADSTELFNRVRVFDVFMSGDYLDTNPLVPPSPSRSEAEQRDNQKLRQFQFWHLFATIATIKPGPTQREQQMKILPGLRSLLDGRENRDFLYSIAILRVFGSYYTYLGLESEKYKDEKNPVHRLAVAAIFIRNEALPEYGTTSVVRRFSELAVEAFIDPGSNCETGCEVKYCSDYDPLG